VSTETRSQPLDLGQGDRGPSPAPRGAPTILPPASPREISPRKAKSILAGHVASGKQIVMSAAMVGDEDDFAIWSRRCENWTKLLRESLARIYGEESATTFHLATAASPHAKHWQKILAAELERIQTVVEMLVSLSDGAR
jgi:hypothetical protein